jgi:hypothetical protein
MPKGVPAAGFRMTKGRMNGRVPIPNRPFIVSDASDRRSEANEILEFKPQVHFSINERFEFIDQLVGMVADNIQPSAIITGKGGLGKTYTVLNSLEKRGYKNISGDEPDVSVEQTFRVVKGHSSPKGLYRSLFENQNNIIVFDDTDSVLDQDISLNILKAALDSYNQRIINWNADLKDDDLPRQFEFNGRIIFISNRSHHTINQAIRSRSMMVDLTMTNSEMIERMAYIASQPSFMPDYKTEHKKMSLEFLREHIDEVRDISLRTLISVVKICSSGGDWQKFAKYIISVMPTAS